MLAVLCTLLDTDSSTLLADHHLCIPQWLSLSKLPIPRLHQHSKPYGDLGKGQGNPPNNQGHTRNRIQTGEGSIHSSLFPRGLDAPYLPIFGQSQLFLAEIIHSIIEISNMKLIGALKATDFDSACANFQSAIPVML